MSRDLEPGFVEIEALEWLAEPANRYGGQRFADEPDSKPVEFVKELYKAGAVKVNVLVREGMDLASQLRVEMPDSLVKRRNIFRILQQEENEYDEDFSVSPNGRDGREMTAKEAKELGDPELAGFWIEEEGPIKDIGQRQLDLWWD